MWKDGALYDFLGRLTSFSINSIPSNSVFELRIDSSCEYWVDWRILLKALNHGSPTVDVVFFLGRTARVSMYPY